MALFTPARFRLPARNPRHPFFPQPIVPIFSLSLLAADLNAHQPCTQPEFILKQGPPSFLPSVTSGTRLCFTFWMLIGSNLGPILSDTDNARTQGSPLYVVSFGISPLYMQPHLLSSATFIEPPSPTINNDDTSDQRAKFFQYHHVECQHPFTTFPFLHRFSTA